MLASSRALMLTAVKPTPGRCLWRFWPWLHFALRFPAVGCRGFGRYAWYRAEQVDVKVSRCRRREIFPTR